MKVQHGQKLSLPTSNGYRDIQITVYYDENSAILSKLFGAAVPADRYGLAVDDKENKAYFVLYNDKHQFCHIWDERHDEPTSDDVQEWFSQMNEKSVQRWDKRRAIHFDDNHFWGGKPCVVDGNIFYGRDAIRYHVLDDGRIEEGCGFLLFLNDNFLQQVI